VCERDAYLNLGSANIHLIAIKLSPSYSAMERVMKSRNLLRFTVGFVLGAAALTASVQAAPLPPIAAEQAFVPSRDAVAEPAVVSQEDVDRLKPEEVRWGHHWHHHHWGWHRHHWHRHHWGWRRHHWHHRHW
jgi:hypothetical protein